MIKSVLYKKNGWCLQLTIDKKLIRSDSYRYPINVILYKHIVLDEFYTLHSSDQKNETRGGPPRAEHHRPIKARKGGNLSHLLPSRLYYPTCTATSLPSPTLLFIQFFNTHFFIKSQKINPNIHIFFPTFQSKKCTYLGHPKQPLKFLNPTKTISTKINLRIY